MDNSYDDQPELFIHLAEGEHTFAYLCEGGKGYGTFLDESVGRSSPANGNEHCLNLQKMMRQSIVKRGQSIMNSEQI